MIDAKGRGLLRPWLTFIGLSYAPIVVAAFLVGANLEFIESLASEQSAREFLSHNKEILVTVSAAFVVFILIVPVMNIWYRVREFRYFARSIQFKGCTFTSALTARRVIGLIALAILAAIISVTLMTAPIGYLSWSHGLPPVVMGIVAFVETIIVMQVVLAVVFQYGLFAHVCATFTVRDPAAFATAVQSGDAGPATGEGFADALDVGGF